MPTLNELEYPRHVHKLDGVYLQVNSAQEAAAALKQGWALTPPQPESKDAPPAESKPPAA